MRELSFSAHPERHDLVSVCFLNELLNARTSTESKLRLMLPAAEGALINLPVPTLLPDLLGDRAHTLLNLVDLLKLYLDYGGQLQVATSWSESVPDPTLRRLAYDLSVHSAKAEVRAYPNLTVFAVVGQCSAIDASMRPGRFALNEGLFRYYHETNEVSQRVRWFDEYWQRTPVARWQTEDRL